MNNTTNSQDINNLQDIKKLLWDCKYKLQLYHDRVDGGEYLGGVLLSVLMERINEAILKLTPPEVSSKGWVYEERR